MNTTYTIITNANTGAIKARVTSTRPQVRKIAYDLELVSGIISVDIFPPTRNDESDSSGGW